MTMSTKNDDLIADRAVLFSASTYFQLINALAYVHFIRSRGSKAEAIIGPGHSWNREMQSGPYAAFAKEISSDTVEPNADYLRSTRAVLEGLARHLPERDLPEETFALLILPPMRMPDVAPTPSALDALVRKMVADFGYVVLKPHPADDLGALAFDGLPVHIDTSPGAVEHTMLEARDRISAVVSYRSTAAWTAKLLFDLPSYIVGPPVTDRNIERIFNALTESYGDPE